MQGVRPTTEPAEEGGVLALGVTTLDPQSGHRTGNAAGHQWTPTEWASKKERLKSRGEVAGERRLRTSRAEEMSHLCSASKRSRIRGDPGGSHEKS